MDKIQIKKFLKIMFSIVLTFCLILSVGLWIFLKAQDTALQSKNNSNMLQNNSANDRAGSNIESTEGTEQSDLGLKPKDTDAEYNFDVTGEINVKSINALIKAQKYTLLTKGSFDSKKINEFIKNNIRRFIPAQSPISIYKLSDLNKDGINEIGLMYEKIKEGDKYLMISALRWKKGEFIKDIDKVLKKNDYNLETNEIIEGDIITGGNTEFIYLQKDTEGIKGSRIKIAVLFDRGFSDFYTQDVGCELEVSDFNNDDRLELYTSIMDGTGIKHMSWRKWNGKEFTEYKNLQRPINNETGSGTGDHSTN